MLPCSKQHGEDKRRFWLVPVSIMRRKTLVNFDLHDEGGKSLPLPGLRLTQHLDESMLWAMARYELGEDLAQDTAQFIHDVIAGELKDVRDRVNSYSQGGGPEQIQRLREEPRAFDALFRRLSYHFVLYSFVEIDKGRRHRIIHMSTDEPLALYYRKPGLPTPEEQTNAEPSDGMAYERGERVKWCHPHQLGASLGLIPTKIRFPVPAAENAASFHFEVVAPPGVDIVEASMLAGRPHETGETGKSDHQVSFDRVKQRLPTVGLHVAAVPNGSSSRAQVYLQVAVRGWYATMAVSCIVTFILLYVIWRHLGTSQVNTSDLVALLVSAVAAVATLITQGEFEGIAGRLLGLPRVLAGTEALLLLAATALFLFTAPAKGRGPRPGTIDDAIGSMCLVAGLITAVITLAWALAYFRQRKDKITSPWEMGPDFDPSPDVPKTFWEGAKRFGYTRPAIRVDSAEAWHYQFRWTQELDEQTRSLRQPSSPAPDPPPRKRLRQHLPWVSLAQVGGPTPTMRTWTRAFSIT